MNTFRSILANVLSTVIVLFGGLMAYVGYAYNDGMGLIITGLIIAFIAYPLWLIIHPKGQEITERAQDEKARLAPAKARAKDAAGVHWFWWVAALFLVPALVGLPLLIVIAIIHVGRKNRATMREVTAAQ